MRKRIVFTTWGSLGDLHPYLAPAFELQRRGHDVAVRAKYTVDRLVRELQSLLTGGVYGRRAAEVAAIVQAEEGFRMACDAIEQQLR